jgi:hypothetical protein
MDVELLGNALEDLHKYLVDNIDQTPTIYTPPPEPEFDSDEDIPLPPPANTKIEDKIAAVNPLRNLLDPVVREELGREQVYYETLLLSEPINSTITIEGIMSGVRFHEQELIKHVKPDQNVVMYRCNFGIEVYDSYDIPKVVKPSNRGRKKRVKNGRPRKKQGNGGEMYSQITLLARSDLSPPIGVVVPSDAKLYKFKVFRTGDIQLPGASQQNISDAINQSYVIAAAMREILTRTLPPDTPPPDVKLEYMIPTMKNYKLHVKLPPKHIINLTILRELLLDIKFSDGEGENQITPTKYRKKGTDAIANVNPILPPWRARLNVSADRAPPHPRIFRVEYTRQCSKLALIFSTATQSNPTMTMRYNIFMRGCINILGAMESEKTTATLELLNWILETNYDAVIVREGQLPPPGVYNIPGMEKYAKGIQNNIRPLTSQERDSILRLNRQNGNYEELAAAIDAAEAEGLL